MPADRNTPMLVEVPIIYSSSGRRAGNSINSTLMFREMVTVEVTEVSEDEARVAAEWRDDPPAHLNATYKWIDLPAARSQHVRTFGGGYWRPMRNAAGEHLDLHAFLDRARLDPADTAPPRGMKKDHKAGSEADYFETVERSQRSRKLHDARAAARDLLLVDDMAYERCLEPAIGIMAYAGFMAVENGTRIVRSATALRIVTDTEGQINEMMPIHMFRQALGKARKANRSQRADFKEALNASNAMKEPVLTDPYFADPANAAISLCAIKLRQFLGKLASERDKLLPTTDIRKLRLFCDLSDALAAIPDEGALDAVETLGRTYLDFYERVEGYYSPEQDMLKEAIAAAEARTIAVLEPRVTAEPPAGRSRRV